MTEAAFLFKFFNVKKKHNLNLKRKTKYDIKANLANKLFFRKHVFSFFLSEKFYDLLFTSGAISASYSIHCLK